MSKNPDTLLCIGILLLRSISFIINRQKLISLLIKCKVKIGGTGITLHRFQINLLIL